ncbi:MAG: hypothetical protein ABWX96_06380, partial [Propionibacteriaceae bacterium]
MPETELTQTDLAPLAQTTRPRQNRRRTSRRGPLFVPRLVVALVSCLVLLFPLYWMVSVAFSPRQELLSTELRLWPKQFTMENFDRIFASFPVW